MLVSAVALPLVAALLLPVSLRVVVCRFGMVATDDCCAGQEHQDAIAAHRAGARLESEPCCSLRPIDLGTPLAERSARLDATPSWVLTDTWTIAVDPGLARPAAARHRPAARAIGPPLRVLKQSFLI